MNKQIPQTQSQLRQRRKAGYQPPNPIRLTPAPQAAAQESKAPHDTAPVAARQGIDTLPLAMAYVPFQAWGTTYEPEKALARGTVFSALDLPFMRGART